MTEFFANPWVWVVISVGAVGLCAYLPVAIENDDLRKKIYWFILVPASLILMFYIYPMGLEIFRRLAMHS